MQNDFPALKNGKKKEEILYQIKCESDSGWNKTLEDDLSRVSTSETSGNISQTAHSPTEV